MSSDAPARKKPPWVKLAVLASIVLVAAAFMMRGVDLRPWIEEGMAKIRAGGPWLFFTAMALLPGLGVPMLTFSLTAGSAFGERLGMAWVVVLAIVATTLNLAIAYALAHRALRPLLGRLVARLGYQLPRVAVDDAADLVAILRLTPGIPFFVQNYLLGLAEVPVGKYLVVSCLISWPYTVGFVLFGDALLQGKGKMVLIAGSLLLAAGAATHLARKHYARKKAET